MMSTDRDLDQRVLALRSAFDDAFRMPRVPAQHDAVDLLLISVAGQPYALRINELAGVHADRKTIPMPLDTPGLAGLCAIRGELVAVFDLAAVLGTPSRTASARWIALHRDGELIGLAFEQVLGSRRVDARDVQALRLPEKQAHFSREAIQVDSRLVHVLDVPSVVSSIRHTIHRR